jgi:hypothetical protein
MQYQLLLYNAMPDRLIYGCDSAQNRLAFYSAIKANTEPYFSAGLRCSLSAGRLLERITLI